MRFDEVCSIRRHGAAALVELKQSVSYLPL